MASISPDAASGVTMARALRQPSMWRKETLMNGLVVALAGRAAETFYLPDTSPCLGGLSDLIVAKSIAELSIASLGYGPRGVSGLIPCKATRKEIAELLSIADANATDCLHQHIYLLDRVARMLFLKEKVTARQVRQAAKVAHLRRTYIKGDIFGRFVFDPTPASLPRLNAPRRTIALEFFNLVSDFAATFLFLNFLIKWLDGFSQALLIKASNF
mmetsp:Transcript_23804/g.30978  ORF Transcript_23804/g.30978 Transcript_23804/m.30978 type:complete len:215 (-) Transcript_23804:996-1640(-)